METVLNRLGKGRTNEDILESWPELARTAIAEAVNLATATLVERYQRGGETLMSQLILDAELVDIICNLEEKR